MPLKSGEGAYVADAGHAGRDRGGRAGGRPVRRDQSRTAPRPTSPASATTSGNVVGLMPHPEHAVDGLTGSGTDGLGFFESVISVLAGA